MTRLDTEALRTLCAVVDHGGVTRAAEQLALSQSAVSHKIKRMEVAIGCTLLTRRAGGAPLLTEEGERLLTYARRICALHDEAMRSLSRQPPLSGRIRLGLTEDVTSSDLSRFLGRFARIYPDVTVRAHVRQSLVLQRQLEAGGEIDLALMQVFAHEVRVTDTILYIDTLRWVCAADMRLRPNSPVGFLSYDKDCFYQHWAMTDGQPDTGLTQVLECASSAGIASAVRAGLGVALLPERYVTDDMRVLGAPFVPPPSLTYVLRIGARTGTAPPVKALAREIAAGGVAQQHGLRAV